MTGGPNDTCVPVADRGGEPLEILVASLDDGAIQQELSHELHVATARCCTTPCCPVSFHEPLQQFPVPLIASLDFSFGVLPAPSANSNTKLTAC